MTEAGAVFGLAGVGFKAVSEGSVLIGALFLGDKHAGRGIVLAREPRLSPLVLDTLVLKKGASLLGRREHVRA